MVNNIYNLGAQVGQGGYSFQDFQQQYALQQLQFSLNNAVQTAQQAKLVQSQQNKDAALANAVYWASALGTVENHQETIKATRKVQEFQNAVSDRNLANTKNIIRDFGKTLSYNYEVSINRKNSLVGQETARQAASGTEAGVGSNKNLILQAIRLSDKETNLKAKEDYYNIKKANEEALGIQISKAFNNWTIETQIDFSNKVLKSNIY